MNPMFYKVFPPEQKRHRSIFRRNIPTLILVLILTLAGYGNNEARAAKTKAPKTNQLVYASTKDIRNINPHLYGGEMAAQNMVFEPLVVNTMKGLKPGLAKNWEISPDGRVYTFHLREGVKFTDGVPLNAEAVKLNIDAVVANKPRHAWLELVNQINGTDIVDEMTFRLTLKNAYYPTLDELALIRPFRFISPNCFINGATKDGVKAYIGTGPWMLSDYKPNQYTIFTANPNYWGTPPRVDSVKWKVMPDHQTILLALQKGEIHLLFGADGDMIDLDSFQALEQQGRYQTFISHPIASRAILLNAHQPVTRDLTVRRAFEYVVDKKGIAQGILNGSESVAQTLMSPGVPYCNVGLAPYSYDPAKAGRLLDEAGWKMGEDGFRHKDGKQCELSIYFNANNSQERTISEFIQSNMKAVGVKLNIVGEEKQAFLDRQKSGKFDLQYSLSWGIPYDPQSYISSWRIPAHGDYQAQLGLKQKDWLDKAISDLLIEPDKGKRQDMYKQVLTYIHDSCVYIPLTFSRTKAVAAMELKGVGFNPSQYGIPFEKMYFEK